MDEWRFVETEDDGATWMRNTRTIAALVEFRERSMTPWYRIMVVTRAWIEEQISPVVPGLNGGGRVVFSPMLVVANGSPSELRVAITNAVKTGGLSRFATEVKDVSI